jgi:hypothetical protein
MTEHDERNETPEDAEVEAHGLKEVAATGMSAAALLAAGAGAASAATPTAAHPSRNDPTMKVVAGGHAPDATNKGARAGANLEKKSTPTAKAQRASARSQADFTFEIDATE